MLGNLFQRETPTAQRMSVNEYARLYNTGVNKFWASDPSANVTRLAANAYDCVGPVGAVVAVRALVFSEIRFQWQRYQRGKLGGLFGDQALAVLERPWTNGTTGSLLNVMELDASLAGNGYYVGETGAFRNEQMITWLDPTKVNIITGDVTSREDDRRYGSHLVGYGYTERPGAEPVIFLPEEVAHYKPLPSRDHPQFKGQSWLSSVIPDVEADYELTKFKGAFMVNGAIPGLVASYDASITPEQFDAYVATLDKHAGVAKAFKTLHFGGGADVKTVGLSFEQLGIKAVQGGGESRIASAAGVPVAIAGFSEGLQGSSLNTGNYGAARRRFADGTLRPLWREACGALSTIARAPADCRLWYDESAVSFLQEDVKDDADIKYRESQSIRNLLDSGFAPDSVIEAVNVGDWSLLKHTGLFSVQLQKPGSPVQNTPAVTAPADD